MNCWLGRVSQLSRVTSPIFTHSWLWQVEESITAPSAVTSTTLTDPSSWVTVTVCGWDRGTRAYSLPSTEMMTISSLVFVRSMGDSSISATASSAAPPISSQFFLLITVLSWPPAPHQGAHRIDYTTQ